MIVARRVYHPDGLSLDRLEPEKGYIEGNVVFCKCSINTMKGPLTETGFYQRMQQILQVHGRNLKAPGTRAAPDSLNSNPPI